MVCAYVPSFLISFKDTSPYEILSDEIDVIVKETIAQGDTSSEDIDLLEGAEDGPLEELGVRETIYEEKEPKILRTLLTGLPSPTSALWSWITFGINMALVTMALDLTFRAPILYPCHDLSFARVGYVSDRGAKILVRELGPDGVKVLYRPTNTEKWSSQPATADTPHV